MKVSTTIKREKNLFYIVALYVTTPCNLVMSHELSKYYLALLFRVGVKGGCSEN
jgi:uncharacterized protein (UPF0261 family)